MPIPKIEAMVIIANIIIINIELVISLEFILNYNNIIMEAIYTYYHPPVSAPFPTVTGVPISVPTSCTPLDTCATSPASSGQ